MSRPSCWAGPVSATDWPRTTCVSVTPWAAAIVVKASPSAPISFPHMLLLPRIADVGRNATWDRPCLCYRSAAEEFAHFVHEALGARAVAVGVLLQRLVELTQELLLAVGEAHRRFHHHLAHEVAGVARANALDALAAKAEHLAGLRFRGHLDLGGAVERRDLDLAAQRCLGEADRHLAMQVVAFALEDGVLLEVDHDVEVA